MEYVRISPVLSVLRVFDPPVEEGARVSYQGSGLLNRCAPDIALLEGFSGVLTRRHMRDIASQLLAQGVHWLYISRPAGMHKVPRAVYISEGIWSGHWLMDLAAVRLAPRDTDDEQTTG